MIVGWIFAETVLAERALHEQFVRLRDQTLDVQRRIDLRSRVVILGSNSGTFLRRLIQGRNPAQAP